jgi:mRNA-degrading endonuclease RelE of RelBE toxin-antitoxin system
LTQCASLTHTAAIIFIESAVFTADVKELLSDEEYAALQAHLASRPDAGDLITQTGGLRKIRWSSQGRGKRGGTRVIYYHVVAQAHIRMILIYRKGVKDDLTPREKAVLRKLNEDWQR